MTRMTMALAVLAAMLSGCASTTGIGGRCRDSVRIVHADGKLKVAPAVLKVCRGDTITVTIVPPNRPVDLTPKAGSAPWVAGSSASGSDILLTVPLSEPVSTPRALVDRGYTVVVTGVGTIDPIFRIIR